MKLRNNADAGMIYWADLFMGFTTGFVVIWNLRRRVIREPRAVAEYYVRYGTFWPDFLSSLPTIAEVCISRLCARKTPCVRTWILPLQTQACKATPLRPQAICKAIRS